MYAVSTNQIADILQSRYILDIPPLICSCYRTVSSTLWEIFSEFPIFPFQQAFNNKVVTARCLFNIGKYFPRFSYFAIISLKNFTD